MSRFSTSLGSRFGNISRGGRGHVNYVPITTSLKLWLDASDLSTITESSGFVSQWNDKSGNNYNATQGTGSLQPVYTASSQNGKAGIAFDATDDYMANGYAPNWNAIDFTIFTVAKMTDAGNTAKGILSNRFGAGAANWFAVGRSDFGAGASTLCMEVGPAGALEYVTTGVEPIGAGAQICTAQKSSGNGIIYLNNELKDTVDTSGSNYGNATNELRIGNWLTLGWGGLIYEVLLYERVLSTSEITRVNTYLSNKWAVTLA